MTQIFKPIIKRKNAKPLRFDVQEISKMSKVAYHIFLSFNNVKFLYVKKIWTNSQCRVRNNRRKREFSKKSVVTIIVVLSLGITKVLLVLKERGDLSFFISKLKLL